MKLKEIFDKYLIYACLAIFALVVLYILKKRFMPFFTPIAWLLEYLMNASKNFRVESINENNNTIPLTPQQQEL